ncbi:MAG: hypothetical protein IJL60_02580 [Clostridiales bacterium]|nr:hypothetical protein [Clostridiales bacterium]MBQ6272565.1 hypothetical protein [Clostridiales bacterium]
MGKIYGKTSVRKRKKKKRNEQNRLRNIIINFRVSPKEKEVIDARIITSGMKKQDYYRQSCLFQKVLVKGNIRSFDAIRRSLRDISKAVNRNPDLSKLSTEQQESLKMILQILEYLFGGEQNQSR